MTALASAAAPRPPRRARAWRRASVEGLLLLAAGLLVAVGGWVLRTPRLPLRADVSLYRLELPFPVVTPAEALALYEAGQYLFVDTRDVDPETAPRVPGSFPVRQGTFDDDLLAVHGFLSPSDRVVLYGDGDMVTAAAIASRLQARGYADLTLLRGDLAGWRAAGGPVAGGEASR